MKRRRWPALLARACLASALVVPAACERSPVGTTRERPAEILSTAITDSEGAVFRTLSVQLDGESRVRVDYWTSDGPRLRTETGEPASSHDVFLGRLRADREYVYEVSAYSPDGEAGAAWTGAFATDTLPADLAGLRFVATGQASFDLLLLEIGRPSGPRFPVVVDADGSIVWYSVHEGRTAAGFTLFEDSLFAFNTSEGIKVISPRSQELAMSLTRARAAQRTGLDPFIIHHDVTATPAGTLLFLVLDPTIASDTVWMGEAVWEWDPRTDQLDRRWRAGDFLDPVTDRGPRSRPDDWLHANSLALGPRGNVLVSFFWLHEVLSIAPGWSAVEWRLGGPASTFQGVEHAMEAGQHTPAEIETDRVLLFDNGLDRGEGLFSRVLEIRLDRDRGTADVVWEFRPIPDIYAPIVSSAQRLPGGNTLVNFGLVEGFSGEATGPLAFFEVTPAGIIDWRMDVVRGAELVYRISPLATIAGEVPWSSSSSR